MKIAFDNFLFERKNKGLGNLIGPAIIRNTDACAFVCSCELVAFVCSCKLVAFVCSCELVLKYDCLSLRLSFCFRVQIPYTFSKPLHFVWLEFNSKSPDAFFLKKIISNAIYFWIKNDMFKYW